MALTFTSRGVLFRERGLAMALACCCDCPCGSSPPDIPETLTATLSDQSGEAVCLPGSFELVWDGNGTWVAVLQGGGIDHSCLIGDLTFQLRCGSGGYTVQMGCFGTLHDLERVSQECNPLRLEFAFNVTDPVGACLTGSFSLVVG